MSDGDHTYTAYVQDQAGNVNSTLRTVTVDAQLPDIVFDYPINTSYNNYIVEVNYTFTEGSCDSVWFSSDDGGNNESIVSCGTNFTLLSGNSTLGSNNWTLYINDTAGNENSTLVTFDVDDDLANITFVDGSIANGTTQSNSDIFMNVSGDDSSSGGGNVSVFIDDGSLVGWWRMDDVNGSGIPLIIVDNVMIMRQRY